MGLHGKAPLLRLQSDERLIAFTRRGNQSAFEVLFSRYNTRLLAFCRHLLGSKEDAEDVLQEVMAAAFNAILADDRPINVRPWLYRIARNRSLNHLRRAQAIGVDSMDIHLSEHGATTADKVHERERFRILVGDIHELPETQRTALVLREMDALSYEQIAEAMETTVPGVKSLLVRARIALAEAAEARQLSCDDVRLELGEVAEGIRKKPDALARRHLKSCSRCSTFQGQLKKTNKALAAVLPIGPFAALKGLTLFHLGHSAGTGSGAAGTTAGATSAGATGAGATGAGATAGVTGAGATGAGAAGAGAAGATAGAAGAGAAGAGAGAAGAAGAGASVIGSAGSALSAGAGAIAGKAAAGLAAAAIVTAGAAVETSHTTHRRLQASAPAGAIKTQAPADHIRHHNPASAAKAKKAAKKQAKPTATAAAVTTPTTAATVSTKAGKLTKATADKTAAATTGKTTTTSTTTTKPTDPGRSQTQSDPTVLTSPSGGSTTTTAPASSSPDPSSGGSSTTPSSTTTSPSYTTSPNQSSDPSSSGSGDGNSSSTGSDGGSQNAGSSQYGNDPVSSGSDGNLIPAPAPTG
jgi:RNA polymerase sigma factor (sigma-70 family)